MKIAIDARGINWYKGTGIGTYTSNVLKNMLDIDHKNEYYIYWCGDNYQSYKKHNSNIIMCSNRHHRFFEENYFPFNLEREQVDLYHVPQNGIGLSDTIKCKTVVTIHDLIPYLLPHTVGSGYQLKFLKEVPTHIQASHGIITVSNWSKKDILKFFPMKEDKIYVTPLAASEKYKPLNKESCKFFLKNSYNITKPFILYLGGFSSRKNVRLLIDAFSKCFSKFDKEYQLVIVGSLRDEGKKLKTYTNSLDISDNVIFTNFVPDEDLVSFYNGCDVFVYPSLYEGFGLPPLEAMNCGTPVITSNITSIPEVVEDGGILIDPTDIDALSYSLYSTLNDDDLLEQLGKKALERSKNFSWQNTAKKTLKIYEEIIKKEPRVLNF